MFLKVLKNCSRYYYLEVFIFFNFYFNFYTIFAVQFLCNNEANKYKNIALPSK